MAGEIQVLRKAETIETSISWVSACISCQTCVHTSDLLTATCRSALLFLVLTATGIISSNRSSGHCTSGCVSHALGKNLSHRTNDVLWSTSWLIKHTFERIYAKISAQLQHQWYGAIISSADRIHLEPQCPFYLISLIMPLDLDWKCRITGTYVLVHSYWRYRGVHILSRFAHSVVVMNNLQFCSCYRQQRTSRHHPFIFSFSLWCYFRIFSFYHKEADKRCPEVLAHHYSGGLSMQFIIWMICALKSQNGVSTATDS